MYPPFKLDVSTKDKKLLGQFLNALILSALRQSSYLWPPRTMADRKATTRRGYRKCAECKMEVRVRDTQKDHVVPVSPVDGSFDPEKPDWNVVIPRMFPYISGWQILCKPCHKRKTKAENAAREKNRSRK